MLKLEDGDSGIDWILNKSVMSKFAKGILPSENKWRRGGVGAHILAFIHSTGIRLKGTVSKILKNDRKNYWDDEPGILFFFLLKNIIKAFLF